MPAPSPTSGSAPTAPRCVEVLQDLQAIRDDVVRAAALQVGDEADAAGIVLVARIVEAGQPHRRTSRLVAAGAFGGGARLRRPLRRAVVP